MQSLTLSLFIFYGNIRLVSVVEDKHDKQHSAAAMQNKYAKVRLRENIQEIYSDYNGNHLSRIRGFWFN